VVARAFHAIGHGEYYRPAPDGVEPWLDLTQAAAHLDVSPKTLRLEAERGELSAIHPLADGPWIFSRAEVDASAAKEIAHRVERSAIYPKGPHPDQQTLFPSMTW
jgi:hypothetical protein